MRIPSLYTPICSGLCHEPMAQCTEVPSLLPPVPCPQFPIPSSLSQVPCPQFAAPSSLPQFPVPVPCPQFPVPSPLSPVPCPQFPAPSSCLQLPAPQFPFSGPLSPTCPPLKPSLAQTRVNTIVLSHCEGSKSRKNPFRQNLSIFLVIFRPSLKPRHFKNRRCLRGSLAGQPQKTM